MIHIDEEKCTACGVCGEICPRHIMEVIDEDGGKETRIVPEREGLCMTCGHCAAVCPSEAITIDGLDPAAFSDVSPLDVEPEAMLALMAQRRSTRRYRNRPVPRDVLDRIAAAAHTAPTGTGSMSTGVIIIDGEERLVEMMKLIYADFEKLQDALGKNDSAHGGQTPRGKETTVHAGAVRHARYEVVSEVVQGGPQRRDTARLPGHDALLRSGG